MTNMHRLLAKALKTGGDLYSFDDIMSAIGKGEMQSFSDGNTWVITRVLDFPRARVLELFMAVGTMDGVRGMSARVEEYARSVGAAKIVAEGRLGWNSFNEEFGWKKKPTHNFYKELV